ncbi:Rz1-like lysis system protein LysC [Yersinia sp. 2542 StPb PI]|uniref:Rz1-like lysis system protein LysC n=1 Tax=Yersinia sp. 2542 StPb PI TaxID=3117408 RepID=UPI003B27ECEB
MKVTSDSGGSRLRGLGIRVLIAGCLIATLASCKSSPPAPRTAELIQLWPPESALTQCEVPEFVGTTWGDSGLYALALKRELRICKGRLDEIISWRQNAGRKM